MKIILPVLASAIAVSFISSALAKNIPYQIISQGNQISCVATIKKNHINVCDIQFHAINPYGNYAYHTRTQTLSAKIGGQTWDAKMLLDGSHKILCESFPHSLFGEPKIQSFQYCENPDNNYIKIDYLFHYPDHHGVIYSSEKMHVNLVSDGFADIHFVHTILSPQHH